MSIKVTLDYNKSVALPVTEVNLVNKYNNIYTNVLLDSAAQRSFISSEIVNKLNLKTVGRVNLTISGFLAKNKPQYYDVVEFTIAVKKQLVIITAAVIDNLDISINMAGLTNASKYLTDQGVILAHHATNDRVRSIKFIIGADHIHKIALTFTSLHGVDLMGTKNGYALCGTIPHKFIDSNNFDMESIRDNQVFVARIGAEPSPLSVVHHIEEESIPIHKLWDIDSVGIKHQLNSMEDIDAHESYGDKVYYYKGQYWVSLPWKINPPSLPSNFSRAKGQLKSLIHHLSNKPKDLECYHKIMLDQLSKNFIERVDETQFRTSGVHYLPHHGVKKDSVTTPIRVVFNCSSSPNKFTPSLNDCLIKGPNLTQKLSDALINFRIGKYAYASDISRAFLRVGLQSQDRDFTRFLWPADPFNPNSKINVYRFKSVLFGSKSSSFLLQATLEHHFKNYDGPFKAQITNSFYVDNIQGTIDCESDLIDLYDCYNQEMLKANMPLQSWNSNSINLRKTINNDYSEEILQNQGVLGLNWNTLSDSLNVKEITFASANFLTRRNLLSRVSSTFDILGLFSPIIIRGKMLIQESWKEKLKWDDPLPKYFNEQWESLQSDLINLTLTLVGSYIDVTTVYLQLYRAFQQIFAPVYFIL